ncbi:MAG: NAD(P)/FAD-dependent oxidoreductase [Flavobacteriales bacterium]|nr:NAD(P)/FAD-dependent oxidoreductase [Flavobacteriales bacterium]
MQQATQAHNSPAPPDLDTDVLILGAGPGGCSAALRLGALGIRPIILEKAVFPRDKVCGDALSGKVMRTLERLDMDLADRVRRDAGIRPSWGVIFVAPGGKALRVPFKSGTGSTEAPGALLPRLRFDDLLFQAVRGTGTATVLQGAHARSITRTATGWAVDLNSTVTEHPARITCRSLLDASGAHSTFARQFGGLTMEPRHHAAGVRAYYQGLTGLDPQGAIELHFLKDLLPGYLWVFPLANGLANVGLGVRSDIVRKRHLDLKAELERSITEHPTLRDRFRSAARIGPIQGMGLPMATKRRKISGERYLLIGDAAHLIDPFTGEGISHAMISGLHAADVMAEALAANDLSARRLRAYDTRVWQRLGQELAISARLQRMADQAWLFDLVVDRATRNPALADTISCMFNDMDLRAKLRRPGFYMDLMMGRGGKV